MPFFFGSTVGKKQVSELRQHGQKVLGIEGENGHKEIKFRKVTELDGWGALEKGAPQCGDYQILACTQATGWTFPNGN